MLSMVGLGLWPVWILVLLFLVNKIVRNTEEFIVEAFILATGSGFLNVSSFPFKFTDLFIAGSVIIVFLFKFGKTINRINIAILLYFIAIFTIALMSSEPMGTQLRMMRYYVLIIAYIVPFFLIKRFKLDVGKLRYQVVLYSVVISLFYVIDGFIFSGFVLIPNTALDGNIGFSRWDNLYWAPLTTYFPRKYPPGLYILMLGAYFMGKDFRLPWYCKITVLLALVACRTITFIFGVVVVYLGAVTRFRFQLRHVATAFLFIVALYVVDKYTSGFMRISAAVEQFAEFKDAFQSDDIEKMAEFGSGRLAQAIPKIELLINRGRLLTGFGFIHPELSNNSDLRYRNPLYSNQSMEAVEIPAEVEITQVQTLLNVGVLGLLIQSFFYIFLIFYLRRNYAEWFFFMTVTIGASVAGLGGFIGLCSLHSLWVALSLAIVCVGKKWGTKAGASDSV